MFSYVESYGRRCLHNKGLQNHSVHAKPGSCKSLPDISVLEISHMSYFSSIPYTEL